MIDFIRLTVCITNNKKAMFYSTYLMKINANDMFNQDNGRSKSLWSALLV